MKSPSVQCATVTVDTRFNDFDPDVCFMINISNAS